MFYNQSIENIKLIILSLDGGLLDLNHLRYNYLKYTCQKYDCFVSKDEFTLSLGNMNTMYQCSPIQDKISNQNLNQMIEKDLFAYSKLKQNIKKEGVDELLQFCRQKGIKIAVITTHKCKRAIQYMQLTGIYKNVDFVIGGDSQINPLPDSQILSTICKQMNISYDHTLVVANFPSLVEAANKLYMNVIYMMDLVAPTPTIEESVYKTAKNNLEIINILLFSKYDTLEMFSPILGMSKNMNETQLTHTYHQLLEKYADDPQLISLVERTYQYFYHLLNKKRIPTHNPIQNQNSENKHLEDTQDSIQSSSINKPSKQIDEPDDSISEKFSDHHVTSATSAISIDAKRMNELMDIINGQSEAETAQQDNEDILQVDHDQSNRQIKSKKTVLDHGIDFICNVLISILIVFICLLVSLILNDYFNDQSLILKSIYFIVQSYLNIVWGLFSFIFNACHQIIHIIPTYNQLLNNSHLLSPLAWQVVFTSIFNLMIIYIIKLIYSLTNKKQAN